MRRVAITGLGVASPVGTGVARFWENLIAGRSGIGRITLFDASTFPVQIGGEVRDACLDGEERDRKVRLGLVAAGEAMEGPHLTDHGRAARATEDADHGRAARATEDADHGRAARATVYVGVGLEEFFLDDLVCTIGQREPGLALLEQAARGGRRVQTPLDRLANLLADRYGIDGQRITNCSACAAGAQAIGQAFRDVRAGRVDFALAGAADSMLNPLGLGGFSLLRVLSNENDRPKEACRPFEASRQGTVLGEGAAFVVLEALEDAIARGATIYAEVLGYGCSLDAFRVSDPEPSGRGAVLSMTKAMRDARISAEEIDCVNAHGTGTPKNDVVETAAIKEALGRRAREIPVHSIKSMTGHMIAASGAAEAVAAALTLHHGVVPPTINLAKADAECDLDYVANTARPFNGRTVLSNSFGFGGQNATLIFGRWRGE